MGQEVSSKLFVGIVAALVVVVGWLLLSRSGPPPPVIDPANPLPGMTPAASSQRAPGR